MACGFVVSDQGLLRVKSESHVICYHYLVPDHNLPQGIVLWIKHNLYVATPFWWQLRSGEVQSFYSDL